MPSQVLDLCSLTKGLVLVTGPTGSGKSTNDSLAELVRKRVIDAKEAYTQSVNKSEIAGMLAKEGFPVPGAEK